ncbi:MAG: DUF1538 domain-containing protein [Butyrivibrio sp.]|nr:DUF1538 domain-containing protein [Butyrivibrio sp.]
MENRSFLIHAFGQGLAEKLKEAVSAVLPVSLLILVLSATPLVGVTGKEMLVFAVSALFLTLGIALFNMGADLAMTPMGEHMGTGLTRSNRMGILLSISFAMGVLITVAEPDLSVLAEQVSSVINGTLMIFTVGIGVGLMLLIAVVKIVAHEDLNALLIFFYFAMFALTSLLLSADKHAFLPLSYDSGGVTTGPITVPFIMSLGVGIALTIGGRGAKENSFGLIALCSAGPILAVMILSLMADGEPVYGLPDYSVETHLGAALWHLVWDVSREVFRSLALLVVFFAVLQKLVLKLPKQKLLQIGVGLAYTFIGLVIFLSAVTVGFMPVGFRLGSELAEKKPLLLGFSFLIGMVVVLAEPAVHVLTHQVEEITSGEVTRPQMMLALSVGVGLSIGLSMLRIVLEIPLVYFLIVGYAISLALSFFVPKIYTAIAFDSGGVASGPLTTGFILPFATGVCAGLLGEGEILSYAFGVVAMVAMTPLITIQLLGFRAVMAARARKHAARMRIMSSEDDQIIYFDWEE